MSIPITHTPFVHARVTKDRIDLLDLYEIMRLSQPPGKYGSVASFCGVVRGADERVEKEIEGIFYETYEQLFLGEKNRIIQEVIDHLGEGVGAICIVHRLDRIPVGDITAAILVSTIHQAEALEAITILTKKMKARLPFWKRVIQVDGYRKLITTNPHDMPVQGGSNNQENTTTPE